MKLTAANTEKEAIGWSLSWKPDGRRSDTFTREAILAYAPPTSAYMGFSTSIARFLSASRRISRRPCYATLARLIFSQHLRATGFTFEPCAEALRKHRASELITDFARCCKPMPR